MRASDDAGSSVHWRLHLASSPARVYRLLATAEGRARFWAVSAGESDGVIELSFPNGQRLRSRVLAAVEPSRYELSYFGGSRVAFSLEPDGRGGTDLALEETGLSDDGLRENRPGWVAVLLALKAAADFGVDLRNGDPARSWDRGYVDG